MKNFLPICFLLFFTISCSTQENQMIPEMQAWNYSELRALDPSDTINPNNDIIAFYSREESNNLQIRIDFLDQKIDSYPFLLLLFNNGWRGNSDLPFDIVPQITWNNLLMIPPDGHVILKNQNDDQVRSPKISIIRDSDLNAIIMNIDKSSLGPLSAKTEIELYSIGEPSAEIDRLIPVRLDTFPPSRRKVMIAFWNTFKSDTPAQALRSWDGAHTGPLSSRHGLVSLVNAIEKTGIPVFLFDIDKQKNWSVFDYLGIDERIRDLMEKGKIISIDQNSTLSSSLDELDGFAKDAIITNQSTEIPSILVRRALLTNTQDMDQVLLIGGDYGKSNWGNNMTAYQMLAYIKNHPWLEPVSGNSFIITQEIPAAIKHDLLSGSIENKLRNFQENRIKTVTEQLLISLNAPGTSMEKDLRQIYIRYIGHLLAILDWSKNRQVINDCSQDLDWDNELECIVATNTLAAVIDLQGGYISYAFSFHDGDYHQIIGPSYQLALGLSDPMSWKLDRGIASDPSVIPGAFSSVDNMMTDFHLTLVEPGTITIQADDPKKEKEFQVTGDSINFKYKGFKDELLAIPLILDPWIMERQDWGYLYSSTLFPHHWIWELDHRISVETIFKDHLAVSTFQDSIFFIQEPENPSFDYPAGHYLPFPLALGQLTADDEGLIEIKISYSNY